MAKAKTIHICQECNYRTPRWMGRCPECGSWNSFIEEVIEKEPESAKSNGHTGYGSGTSAPPIRLEEVSAMETERILTEMSELDRVLGGGFVPGSVVILGGEPGIGKSTIALQLSVIFARRGMRVLYLSGEESLGQIKMRGERLGALPENLFVVSETSLEQTLNFFTSGDYDFIVVDSIQTMATDRLTSTPGSVSQLREVTSTLTQHAKGYNIPLVLIGHVTKEGSIAGPKVLEHMVDTVLYFETQSGSNYRLLRAVKNRFGSTNEVGVFEMRGNGLKEVSNPSAVFLEGRPTDQPGSVVVPVMEGTRPLLCEIQALLSPANYGPPRVTTVGIDSNRALLLLNILENRSRFKVSGMDVFINVVGGMRALEPATDLGVTIAMLSSFFNRPVPSDMVIFGEMGLTGELRASPYARARLKEAGKLGFRRAVLPQANVDIHRSDQEEAWLEKMYGPSILTQAIHHVFGDIRAPRNDASEFVP